MAIGACVICLPMVIQLFVNSLDGKLTQTCTVFNYAPSLRPLLTEVVSQCWVRPPHTSGSLRQDMHEGMYVPMMGESER